MNRIYRVIWNCTLQVFQVCIDAGCFAGTKRFSVWCESGS
ncbi:TPA: hypothetical protein J1560_003431 [Escherichia coli]|nr:hypothetical protein [Escherichia coli]